MQPDEANQLEYFIFSFEIVEVSIEVAKMAGMYMNKYRKSHGINMGDAIIAASAKHLNAKLYTLNTKHFPMKDIDVVRPY